jgi:hypothetical protein
MVSLGELSETASALTVAEHGITIELEWTSSDVAAFKTRPAHTGADPLDDQAPFEFGDGADDDDQGSAQGTAGVDLLAEADELDVDAVQLIEDLEEMLH